MPRWQPVWAARHNYATHADTPSLMPRRHWFPKPYADAVARLRVPAGFVMLAAFAWFSHPTARTLLFGIPLSLDGLALRAWAAGHLAKNQRLAQSGPYAATRNPLYLGSLITALGLAAAGNSAGAGAALRRSVRAGVPARH